MRTSAAESWFLSGEEGEMTRPGGGKCTSLGAWGETVEGGNRESQTARAEDHRITGQQDHQDSQDNRYQR